MPAIEDNSAKIPADWVAPRLRRLAATEAETGAAPDVDGFETFS